MLTRLLLVYVFICHVNLNKAPSFVSYAPILIETQKLRCEVCTGFEQNGCWNENIRLLRLCMKQKKYSNVLGFLLSRIN